MKKYKYQCDNSECNHQFIDDNPTTCPKCKQDDFTIISQVNTNQKNILLSAIILVAVSALFIFYNLSYDTNDDTPVSKSLPLIKPYDNYFVIEDSEGFDDLNIIELDGVNFFRNNSKIYPCKSGKFKVSCVKGDVTEEKIINFDLKISAHPRACKDKFEVKGIFPNRSTCKYEIQTTDDNNPDILVSLNENSGFINQLEWRFDECVNSDYFYVKLRNSEEIFNEKIEQTICKKSEFDNNIFVNSFKLYINDIHNNRSQFYRSYDSYSPRFILVNEEFGLIPFITMIDAMDAVNPSSVESLRLLSSDIEYNVKDREVTLKISR